MQPADVVAGLSLFDLENFLSSFDLRSISRVVLHAIDSGSHAGQNEVAACFDEAAALKIAECCPSK